MEANETVVIGAHFDSRGSFGYPTAPGADDDGSGTALLLALARHIYEHRLTFSRKVVLAAFAGGACTGSTNLKSPLNYPPCRGARFAR